MRKIIPVLTMVAVLVLFSSAGVVMGGGPMMPGYGGTGTIGAGPITGGGMMGMTNSGGFGMTNGMAGAPVVDSDGTAYLVNHNPSTNPGSIPSSNAFESTIISVTPAGTINSLTLKGLVSKPVIYEDALVATASLPDFSNFYIYGNLGSAAPSGQSMLYVVTLPLTSSAAPTGISLDGQFASTPVIANDNIYIVTSDFGNAMMAGNNTFNMMYGNYNFNSTGNAKSYLYILDFSGNLINKIPLQ